MKVSHIFAALAAFALTACGQPTNTQHGGGHGPAASTDPAREDADFAMRLALIEGHLAVGRELIEAGRTQDALPHFGHPVRELYSDMLPVIARRGGQQFDRDLVGLEGLAASQGNSETFRTAFDAALAKVRAARALIPQEKWDSDTFTLGIVVDTAGVAAQEYRNALVAGRLDSLIEYHDTRGFIFYLSNLLASHHGSDPRLAQAATTIAELRTYVEPLTPPNPPRASDVQFEEKVASLRALTDAPPPAQ